MNENRRVRSLWSKVQYPVLGVAVVAALWLSFEPQLSGGRWAQLVLGVVAIAGLCASSRRPVLAVALTGGATALAWFAGLTADPFLLTGFAVYRLAEQRGARRFPGWLLTGMILVVLLALGAGSDGNESALRAILVSAVVIAAAWALGVRTRQVQVEAASRSRAEERLRLARDVHDVLSHTLGSIGMKAGISAHVTTLGEAELRGVLREVESESRASLAELKDLLQRERNLGDSPALGSLPQALAEAVARAEAVGIETTLHTAADLDDLPTAVATTAWRITSEAVTNVIRHAQAQHLEVTVTRTTDVLELQVADDGRGSGSHSGRVVEGHGLTGIRERAGLLGGTVNIAAAPSGFTVSARLPISGVQR